jgi:flagellar hook-basal body complex protein FliE
MSIESIAAVEASPGVLPAPPLNAPLELTNNPASGGAFQSMLSAVTQLNQELQTGEQGLQKMALGGGMDNLHQSLMGMERTRLTLQLLLQVRSRALDAYQELTRMQI